MSSNEQNLDKILDSAIDEIRESALDPRVEQQIADRAWAEIRGEVSSAEPVQEDPQRIRDCADFQALIPAYLQDGLTDAKAMLLEDHVGECLPCRKALKGARQARRTERPAVAHSGDSRVAKWGFRIAVAAAIFLAVVGMNINSDFLTIKAGGLIEIHSLEGDVFRMTEDGAVPVSEGDVISFEDSSKLRTGKGSRALLTLSDQSVVEMNERAELAVLMRRPLWSRSEGDAVIDLIRGDIIVEASDQGSGHLFVETQDANVAVTGTVFAVSSGMKGSRVSVIEGEVRVALPSGEELLHPGDQSNSSPRLARVPVADEIAWSRDLDRHLALLNELTKLSHEIDQALTSPDLRYDSSLLDLAPAQTVIFVGVPNVSQSLNQAYAMLEEKIDSNDILRDWWQESVGTESQDELRQAMEMIRGWGEQLGEEIAVTLQKSGSDVEDPLILSRLTHPGAFPGFVETEMGRLAEEHGEIPAFRVFEGDLALAAANPADRDGDLFFWVQGDLVAISFKLDQLYALAAEWQTSSRAFASGDFHSRLADVYRDGAQWVVGVDVASLSAEAGQEADGRMLEEMGLLDLQHVIGERKERGELTENRIVLTFDQPRKGLASWLAEPAAMGSMDFISPDASIAAGFVMREPASVVDELFGILGSDDAEFESQLEEFQNEHGIDIRKDIAAALGGEFAFALDGPVLPNPSWKLIMEVYDPDQLQRSLAWAVEEINRQAEGSDFQGLTLGGSQQGGRDFFELRSTDTGLAAHYTFVDGYMVAGASRALVDRALRIRDSGINLTNASEFISRLPADGELNFSGAFYQNLGPILGSLSRHIGDAAGRISPDHQQMIEQIGTMSQPTLTLAYGEASRIVFVHSDEGGLFGSSLGAMLRLDSLMSVQQLLEQAGREGADDRSPADDTEVDVRVKTHINQG